MGIKTQKHLPVAGPRAIEHTAHVEHSARGGIDPRVGSRPKFESAPKIHGGMVTRTRDGNVQHGGGDLHSALQSGSVGGLGDQLNCPPKNFGTAPASPGMRSRTARCEVGAGFVHGGQSTNHMGASGHDVELGKAILREAVKSGATEIK